MPLRVVSELFGIPEDYQSRVTQDGDKYVRTERGAQMTDNPDGPSPTVNCSPSSSTGGSVIRPMT